MTSHSKPLSSAAADATAPQAATLPASIPPALGSAPAGRKREPGRRTLDGTKRRAEFPDAVIPEMEARRLVTVAQVQRLLGVSRPTIDRLENEGAIPKSIYICGNRKWPLDEMTLAFERLLANRGRRGRPKSLGGGDQPPA